MPDIILHEIRKTYPNGAVGLLPTDLAVADGECFALLGPSGSGKTTLLRLVAGLETPDGGTLHLGGARADTLLPHQRGISLVTQRPALYPHLDVAENLAISLRFEQSARRRSERVPEPEITQRVREAADSLGLMNLLNRRIHELSGGEQRRVVLGRAVVARRRIWLLDEPFSQLDTPLRDRLVRELHLLRRRLGITIIHVTHDPNEAMALADRVGVLGAGRLLQSGRPDEVLVRPCHRTVAFCFGWPVINLIDGRLEAGSIFVADDESCRIPLPGRVFPTGPATVGIRPEGLRLAPLAGGVPIGTGEVIGVQPLAGHEQVSLQVGRHVIRSLGPAATMGSRVELWVVPDEVRLFDFDSGLRLE